MPIDKINDEITLDTISYGSNDKNWDSGSSEYMNSIINDAKSLGIEVSFFEKLYPKRKFDMWYDGSLAMLSYKGCNMYFGCTNNDFSMIDFDGNQLSTYDVEEMGIVTDDDVQKAIQENIIMWGEDDFCHFYFRIEFPNGEEIYDDEITDELHHLDEMFSKESLQELFIDVVNENDDKLLDEYLENSKITTKDSEGNILSEKQDFYFRTSKARDKDGNLLVVYHGSPFKNITTFNPMGYSMSWFTPHLEYAKHYSAKGKEGEILKCYIRCTKMLDLGSIDEISISDYSDNYLGDNYPYTSDGDPFSKQFIKIAKKLGFKTEEEMQELVERCGVDNIDFISTMTNTEEFKNILEKAGYDSACAVECGEWRTFAIVNPNQAKSITNLNPTFSNNINN